MRIGVDLDNVVYPFTRSFLRWICADDIDAPATRWEFYEDHGLSLREFLGEYANGVDAGFILSGEVPIPGSIETMTRLREAGHSLHLVTDRFVGKLATVNTAEWLLAHKVPYDSLTFAKDKTLIGAQLDTFIDDKPSNVDDLRVVGCRAFLLDCGRSDQAGHPWLISSWAEFERLIKEMEGIAA